MIRNLKALGLSLVAVFAMSALGASSASAVDHFTTKAGAGPPAYLTAVCGKVGEACKHKFEMTSKGINFRCSTAKFLGTALNGSIETTVEATYTGRFAPAVDHNTEHICTQGPANLNVTIDMEGCHYVLTGNTTGHDPTPNTDATISITCPAGKAIKITRKDVGVTLTVPPQTPTTGGVVYKNIANHEGTKSIEVIATATGITTECHPALTCAFGGIPTHDNTSDYTGSLIATCYEDKSTNPTTLTTPVTEGPKLDCEIS